MTSGGTFVSLDEKDSRLLNTVSENASTASNTVSENASPAPNTGSGTNSYMTLQDAMREYRSHHVSRCTVTDALSYLTPLGCELKPGDLSNHFGEFSPPMEYLKTQCNENKATPEACAALRRVTSNPSQEATLAVDIRPSADYAEHVCTLLFGADECQKPCTTDICRSGFIAEDRNDAR